MMLKREKRKTRYVREGGGSREGDRRGNNNENRGRGNNIEKGEKKLC